MIRFKVDEFGGVSRHYPTPDRAKERQYDAEYREKNREKIRNRHREWMRIKRGYYNRHPEEALVEG